MCGPRDVAIDSPEVTTAEGESTGQDRSSAAGIFVLTVEHVHGGGGVLLFVIVIIVALVLAHPYQPPPLWLDPNGREKTISRKSKIKHYLKYFFT